jgi:hypothetical protein
MTPLQICHDCFFRQRPCIGPCQCLADTDRRDITNLFQLGFCPKGFFEHSSERDPGIVSPEILVVRKIACEGCGQKIILRESYESWVVRCKACTICEGGRSLSSAFQQCPLGKW